MAGNGDLLSFLTKKPQRDEAAAARFEARFRASIAEIFLPVAQSVAQGACREYILKGGRGSCKSSFISCEIMKILQEDPLGNALIIRKVGNTLRDSVYAQMLWAIDQLGLSEEWEPTVSPMELTNRITGQKIYFRGLDEPRKLKSIKPRKGHFAALWFEEADELDGKRIPEDISIVGFDDSSMARLNQPPLTTIHQDAASRGEKAVELLLQAVKEGASAQPYVFPVSLAERKSVRWKSDGIYAKGMKKELSQNRNEFPIQSSKMK